MGIWSHFMVSWFLLGPTSWVHEAGGVFFGLLIFPVLFWWFCGIHGSSWVSFVRVHGSVRGGVHGGGHGSVLYDPCFLFLEGEIRWSGAIFWILCKFLNSVQFVWNLFDFCYKSWILRENAKFARILQWILFPGTLRQKHHEFIRKSAFVPQFNSIRLERAAIF